MGGSIPKYLRCERADAPPVRVVGDEEQGRGIIALALEEALVTIVQVNGDEIAKLVVNPATHSVDDVMDVVEKVSGFPVWEQRLTNQESHTVLVNRYADDNKTKRVLHDFSVRNNSTLLLVTDGSSEFDAIRDGQIQPNARYLRQELRMSAAGVPVAFGSEVRTRLYCGRRCNPPRTNGFCGPSNGNNCVECQQCTQPSRNRALAVVSWGRQNNCRRKLYCGRILDRAQIPGSGAPKPGQKLYCCGPSSGPQCADCKALQSLPRMLDTTGCSAEPSPVFIRTPDFGGHRLLPSPPLVGAWGR
jgi:hypothetical protein